MTVHRTVMASFDPAQLDSTGQNPQVAALSGLRNAGSVDNFRRAQYNAAMASGLGQVQVASSADPQQATPLPTEEQELMVDMVIRVSEEEIRLLDYLKSKAGINQSYPGWLGIPELKYRRISRGGSAHRAMLPDAHTESFQLDNSFVVQPVFATWEMFDFHTRHIETAQRLGMPVNLDHGEQATRNVFFAFEDQAVNGAGFNIAGNSTYGLLTAPNANSVTYASSEAWDAAGKTGQEVMNDYKSMRVLQKGDNNARGDQALFIEKNYEIGLDNKPMGDGTTTDHSVTVLEKLSAKSGLDVVTVDLLPDDRTVLQRMSPENIQVIDGQSPQVISWNDNSGMHQYNMVLGCQVVVLLDDYDGQSGTVTGNV